jgi:hypothetical protein
VCIDSDTRHKIQSHDQEFSDAFRTKRLPSGSEVFVQTPTWEEPPLADFSSQWSSDTIMTEERETTISAEWMLFSLTLAKSCCKRNNASRPVVESSPPHGRHWPTPSKERNDKESLLPSVWHFRRRRVATAEAESRVLSSNLCRS